MAGFEYTETIKVEITDAHIDDIIEIASYGGINYWVETLDRYPEERRIELMEFEADGEPIELTYQGIADAIWTIHLGNTNVGYPKRYIDAFVAELRGDDSVYEAGEIDADAADAIIQIAAFGEITYG